MKKLLERIFDIFSKNYTANVCGHQTKLKGRINSLGESFGLEMPLSENGKPDYCLDCISKMSIKCAWCGEPIHIGEPITLFIPKPEYKVPKHAFRYQESVVGCLRMNCGEAMFRAGFWMPPGEVYRVPSPVEMCMSANGGAVFVEDLSDPNNIGKII